MSDFLTPAQEAALAEAQQNLPTEPTPFDQTVNGQTISHEESMQALKEKHNIMTPHEQQFGREDTGNVEYREQLKEKHNLIDNDRDGPSLG